MIKYIICYTASIFCAAGAQVLLKKGALGGKGDSFINSIVHPSALAGYIIMVLSVILTMTALTALPLKVSIAFMPLQYILVSLFSVFFLGEKIHRSTLLGSLIILAGVIVFNL